MLEKLLDDKKPLVYFVGLSAKPNCGPLDPETRTGYIIEKIINRLPTVNTIKTNLVKTPPLDQQGKLRYPNTQEMEDGWDELREELNQTSPSLLVTLGQQVSVFLRSQIGQLAAKKHLPSNFVYESYLSRTQSHVLPIHHPSFVFVYRRKDIENYVENVTSAILSLFSESPN